MNKVLASTLLLLSLSSYAGAQGRVESFVRQNPLRSALNKHCYEVLDSTVTKAPCGYKAFYISHFSRHGSRGFNRESEYAYLDTLMSFQAKGLLTPEAGSLIPIIRSCKERNLELGYGALTLKGEQEHIGIARRMRSNYPSVFNDTSRRVVNSFSTFSSRVMKSRDCFVGSLVSECPGLSVRKALSTESPFARSEVLITSLTEEQKSELAEVHTSPLRDSILAAFDWSRLQKATFVSGEVPSNWKGKEGILFYHIYSTGAIRQCFILEGTGWVEPFFTSDELYTFWAAGNPAILCNWGWCSENKGYKALNASSLIERIIADADAVIEGADTCATLRFSHDSQILPLLCLMGVDWNDFHGPMSEANEHFCSSYSIHMAANLQLVFFRNRRDKVLVKILLNELETTIPGLRPDRKDLFYDWDNLKAWLLSRSI